MQRIASVPSRSSPPHPPRWHLHRARRLPRFMLSTMLFSSSSSSSSSLSLSSMSSSSFASSSSLSLFCRRKEGSSTRASDTDWSRSLATATYTRLATRTSVAHSTAQGFPSIRVRVRALSRQKSAYGRAHFGTFFTSSPSSFISSASWIPLLSCSSVSTPDFFAFSLKAPGVLITSARSRSARMCSLSFSMVGPVVFSSRKPSPTSCSMRDAAKATSEPMSPISTVEEEVFADGELPVLFSEDGSDSH
mmetsp:Transcript_14634/g.29613  ORF Transcript_14634/g.29613 Transcript_14634/m.29613 type:complete len:248 (-) Transcript_14634:1901-2644(-)